MQLSSLSMNVFDEFWAQIPFTEVKIKTTLQSRSVLERIEQGVKPAWMKLQTERFFIFESSCERNFFKIQGHLQNSDGSDAFPNRPWISVGFIRIPIHIETSPVFYGRVVNDEEGGSTIEGHFGVPAPAFGALCIFILLAIGRVYPRWEAGTFSISVLLLFWSLFNLVEFVTERKGILDFVTGLFYDVAKKEK